MKTENLIYIGLAAAALGAVYFISRKPKKEVVDSNANTSANGNSTINTKDNIVAAQNLKPISNETEGVGKSDAFKRVISNLPYAEKLNILEKVKIKDPQIILANEAASLSDENLLRYLKENLCSSSKFNIGQTLRISAFKKEATKRGLAIPQLTCNDINAQTSQTTMNPNVANNSSYYMDVLKDGSIYNTNKDVASLY